MRFKLSEITLSRIYSAIFRRIRHLKESFAWHWSKEFRLNKGCLERYRNIHRGKRCFIIANGPSLGKMDLDLLQDEYTISSNRAYLLYEKWGFSPNYYVCINELILEQFSQDITKLNITKFVNSNRIDLFSKNLTNYDLLSLELKLNLRDKFEKDITKPISSGGTVTFACLQLAYFMGFDKVILIGMDHYYYENGIPNTIEKRKDKQDKSHAHPNYFPNGTKWQLPDLHRSELAYMKARQVFDKSGRSIVDATVDGKCNIFEKVDFKNLFKA